MLFICDSNGSLYEISRASVLATFYVTLAVVLVMYVLRSIGLFIMAKKSGDKLAFLGCIPFAWAYTASKLVADQPFFGKVIKWKPLIIVLIFTLTEAFSLSISLATYIPLAGFYAQGGTVYISSSSQYVPVGAIAYRLNEMFYTFPAVNVSYVYNPSTVSLLITLYYISMITTLFSLILMITVYVDLFKKYFPNHYILASFFSLFGLFGPFVFARRNATPVDFNQYMRERYKAFMQSQGQNFNGQGQNPFNNNQDPFGGNNNSSNEPFGGFGGQNNNQNNNQNSNNNSDNKDEPFGDFDEKNGDKK